MARAFPLAFAVVLLVGCGQVIHVDPSAFPGQPLVLTVDGRGNPPVILRINNVDVAHIDCLEGATTTFAPGTNGVPASPALGPASPTCAPA